MLLISQNFIWIFLEPKLHSKTFAGSLCLPNYVAAKKILSRPLDSAQSLYLSSHLSFTALFGYLPSIGKHLRAALFSSSGRWALNFQKLEPITYSCCSNCYKKYIKRDYPKLFIWPAI